MTRVTIVARGGAWAIFFIAFMGANAAIAAIDQEWIRFALYGAAALAGLQRFARSLRQQTLVLIGASACAALALGGAITERDALFIPLGALVLALIVASLVFARRSGGGTVRTEELVGRTVPAAERLLGYPKGRQPAAMAPPTLVAVPDGAVAPSDLADPGRRADLTVTAVTVDPVGPSITFGVAPSEAIAGLGDDFRAALQAELTSRVGGFPGDLRPAELSSLAATRP